MNDNKNNDLGIGEVNKDSVDNVFDSILKKDSELNVIPTKNTESIQKKAKGKSVTFTMDENHYNILKKHFTKQGIISQSIGIRAALIEYMENHGLIE